MRLTLLLSFILPVYCALVNKTIDDAFPGDDSARITYFPGDAWIAGSRESIASKNGRVRPDPGKAHDGTWHDTTQDSGIDKEQAFLEIAFKGSAIYVYCIIANELTDRLVGTKADYSFFLDGSNTPSDHFFHKKDGSNTVFFYNVLVFSKTDLIPGKHTLKVVPNGGQGVDGSTLMLFDSATISYDDGSTHTDEAPGIPTNPGSNAGNTVASESAVIPKTKGNIATSKGGHFNQTPSTESFATGTIVSTLPTEPSVNAPSGAARSKPDLAAIIGGIIGAFLAAIFIAFLFIFLRRRRRRYPQLQQAAYPFDMQGSGSGLLAPPPMPASPPRRTDRISNWVDQQSPFVSEKQRYQDNPMPAPAPWGHNRQSEAPSMPGNAAYAGYAQSDAQSVADTVSTEGSLIRDLKREMAELKRKQLELLDQRKSQMA